MPASGVSAAAIAARLSDIGLSARVEEHDRYASVQTELPESLSADLWREVLEVVAEADRFGLLATSLNDRTLGGRTQSGPHDGRCRGTELSAIGAEQHAQPYPPCRLAHQSAVLPQGQAPPSLTALTIHGRPRSPCAR